MTNQVVTLKVRNPKSTVTRKVSRSDNDQLRGRRHLTAGEIDSICKILRKASRYPDRDECMVLLAFHHGLRVSELTNLRWQHIDLKTNQIAIKRAKNGIDTTHPISHKREIQLLRRLHKAQGLPRTGFVFLTERQTPVSVSGFQKLFSAASVKALGVKWNAHALRHACGTTLVDKGHDLRTIQVYMGHRNIQNTTQYLHETTRQFDRIEW
jgi:type 1 fimbriae regulatory protein FimB/type 1 fimbriae regulatory protein FimE